MVAPSLVFLDLGLGPLTAITRNLASVTGFASMVVTAEGVELKA
jgi:hypothetical protein